MEQHPFESPRSEEGSPDTSTSAPATAIRRIGAIEGHLPDLVDPLEPRHPETSFEETRRLRHDGWTPEKMRAFHERFAECGIVREACEAAGMSARSAYNLRDRDPLFAAGWEAASLKARTRLADEAYSRSLNGVVERIYKDGVIVAERHRYDNRLTMAVLARLDARIDRAEERGDPRLNVVARWDEYLDALGEGRREEGLALLAPPAPDLHAHAGDRELHELHEEEDDEMEALETADPHDVWESDGSWWTDYPPPLGFDGDEYGSYGEGDYKRELSPDEQAAIDAELAAEEADRRARAEALRDAFFGFADPADAATEHPADALYLDQEKEPHMGIFSSIKDAIFGKAKAKQAQPVPQAGQRPAQQPGAMPQMKPAAQPQAQAQQQPVDVEEVLTDIAREKGNPDLNWRTSIVDLMKLLDLDSSLANRKELATELGYTGEKDGSAEMNIWLQKAVMKELEKNGGKVPAGLKD